MSIPAGTKIGGAVIGQGCDLCGEGNVSMLKKSLTAVIVGYVVQALALLLLAAAAFLNFRGRPKKGLMAALLLLILIFGLLEARDFAYVKYYSLPPQLNLSIETGSRQIKYKKLFYDVYRSQTDTGAETYVISAKQRE